MENTFQLSIEQSEVFGDIGTAFAMAEVDADQAIEDFARAVDPDGTGSASYDIWDSGMAVVRQAYAGKKGVMLDSDTIKSMVKRFYARLDERYGLTKPAKPTDTGIAKAEQRVKAQAVKAVLMAKPTKELQEEIAMLTASPTKANLIKAGKLASIVEDQRAEKLKDVMADIKAKQAEVGKLAKQCLDMDTLEQCLELLSANTYSDSTI
jgi:6-pyruvoyl-tetrahydropterin synthase